MQLLRIQNKKVLLPEEHLRYVAVVLTPGFRGPARRCLYETVQDLFFVDTNYNNFSMLYAGATSRMTTRGCSHATLMDGIHEPSVAGRAEPLGCIWLLNKPREAKLHQGGRSVTDKTVPLPSRPVAKRSLVPFPRCADPPGAHGPRLAVNALTILSGDVQN